MNPTSQTPQLDEQVFAQFCESLEQYHNKPGSLIPALQSAQNLFGYVPKPAMEYISQTLDEPLSRVLGVVTFYSFFSTVPRGKYVIRVCLGTACYVRGGKDVLEKLKKTLNIDVGQTSEDVLFSLEVARCFGACGMAPVIMINDTTHQRVKAARIGDLLELYREKERRETVS